MKFYADLKELSILLTNLGHVVVRNNKNLLEVDIFNSKTRLNPFVQDAFSSGSKQLISAMARDTEEGLLIRFQFKNGFTAEVVSTKTPNISNEEAQANLKNLLTEIENAYLQYQPPLVNNNNAVQLNTRATPKWSDGISRNETKLSTSSYPDYPSTKPIKSYHNNNYQGSKKITVDELRLTQAQAFQENNALHYRNLKNSVIETCKKYNLSIPAGIQNIPFPVTVIIEWINALKYDPTIDFLNSCLQDNFLPPLECMSVLIKKYANPQYGTSACITNIEITVKDIYLNTLNPSSEEVGLFISELMLVYLRRNKKALAKEANTNKDPNQRLNDNDFALELKKRVGPTIGKLGKTYPSIRTKNVLVEMYIMTKQYNAAKQNLKLIKQKYGFDDWTYEMKMKLLHEQAHNSQDGISKAIAYFNKHENTLHNNAKAHEHILKISSTNAARFFYHNNCSDEVKNDESVQSNIISSYAQSQEWNNAWDTFEQMTHPTEKAFRAIIQVLVEEKLLFSAMKLLELSQNKFGFHLNVKPTFEKTNVIEINVHSDTVRAKGSTSYGGFSPAMLAAIFSLAYAQLQQCYKAKIADSRIEIITGKGTYESRNTAQAFFSDTFGWNTEVVAGNAGALFIKLTPEEADSMPEISTLIRDEPNADTQGMLARVQNYIELTNTEPENAPRLSNCKM